MQILASSLEFFSTGLFGAMADIHIYFGFSTYLNCFRCMRFCVLHALWGSQSGTAESFSEDLKEEAAMIHSSGGFRCCCGSCCIAFEILVSPQVFWALGTETIMPAKGGAKWNDSRGDGEKQINHRCNEFPLNLLGCRDAVGMSGAWLAKFHSRGLADWIPTFSVLRKNKMKLVMCFYFLVWKTAGICRDRHCSHGYCNLWRWGTFSDLPDSVWMVRQNVCHCLFSLAEQFWMHTLLEPFTC